MTELPAPPRPPETPSPARSIEPTPPRPPETPSPARSLQPTPPRPPETPSPARSIAPSPARSPEPPAVEPARPQGTEPGAFGLQSLPLEVQEQLFGVLRAALEETLSPLLVKQTELEKRLDALREGEERAALAVAARLAGPAKISVAPARPAESKTADAPVPSVRPSMHSTSFGLVMEVPGGPRRPAIEAELEKVGPIDVPDFGSTRRAAGRVLLGLLLAIVLAAIAATILSYT